MLTPSFNGKQPLNNISIFDIRRKLAALENINFSKLSDEQIAYRIRSLVDDYPWQLRRLELSGIYRARKNPDGTIYEHAKQLWYPDASFVKRPGRLNRSGQARLYAANMPNTAIYEQKLEVGQTYTVLLAGTRSGRIETLKNTLFIGIERSLAPEIASLTDSDIFRRSQGFRQSLGESGYKKWLLIDDFLSGILGKRIDEDQEEQYRLTIALADLLFSMPDLDLISYPSVATASHGINVCMTPEKADQLFMPVEAWIMSIDGTAKHPTTGEILHSIRFLRRSKMISLSGDIDWLPSGQGISTEEINRFVRGRIQTLSNAPSA